MKRIYLILIMVIGFTALRGQSGLIDGYVTDAKTKEAVISASVKVQKDGVLINGAVSDEDGYFNVGGLEAGTYDLLISAELDGYQSRLETGIQISTGQTKRYNVEMTMPEEGDAKDALKDGPLVVSAKKKIIEIGQDKSGESFSREQIANSANRDLTTIAATAARVSQSDEGQAIYSGGGRSDANQTRVNGRLQRGGSTFSDFDIDQLEILTGGMPASEGNAVGAITKVTTRTPPSYYDGRAEVETSQFLDKYGYNRVELGITGPLIAKVKKNEKTGAVIRDELGRVERDMKVGFLLKAVYSTSLDSRPSALGSFKLKDEVLDAIRQHPTQLVNGSIVPTAQYITQDDLESTDIRPNNRNTTYGLNAGLLFKLSPSISVKMDGQVTYNEARQGFDGYRLLNYDRNPVNKGFDWAGHVEFRHFIETSDSSMLRNVSYKLEADYSQVNDFIQDDRHKDNFFNYGYVGNFERVRRPIFGFERDSVDGLNHLVHTSHFDDFVSYTPNTEINPLLTNYNEYVEAANGGFNALALEDFMAYNGAFNSQVSGVYGLHTNAGAVYNNYSKSNANFLGIRARGDLDIVSKKNAKNRHSLNFGIMFEQQVDRNYSLAPSGLWNIANLRANSHLSLDPDRSIQIGDTTLYNFQLGGYENVGIYASQTNDEAETFFSQNLRDKLGATNYEWINVHGLDPSTMNINMFEPTDLIAGNDRVLGYYGYDYLGNPLGTDVTFNDFFTRTQNINGRDIYTRPVSPFSPVYVAGWLEDRFRYKDMTFRFGVRIDRYDANTKVLKDPYTFYGAFTRGEIVNEARYAGIVDEIPSTIGDDFMVYVSDPSDPEGAYITGFRKGDQWYSPAGEKVDDPRLLSTSTLLPARSDFSKDETININPNETTNPYNVDAAFRDFKPVVNLQPRLLFSFPISEDAEFTAHYDIYTQTPRSGTFASPLDYYDYRARVDDNIFGNPNLRPERTTNYEVGYQQALSEISGIKFNVFYTEFRNLIQFRRYVYAYPTEYRGYANDDFSTTKGVTVEYEMARVNNLAFSANYTLQFAEGTGSGPTSNANFTARLRQTYPLSYDRRHDFFVNLDYRFISNPFEKGFMRKLVENLGGNLSINATSGSPYTRAQIATQFGGREYQGSFNGSRLPWIVRLDLRIDKTIALNKKGRKPLLMNIYFRAQNLLNTQNVISVYPATGSPTDDGYLRDPNSNSILKIDANGNYYSNDLDESQWQSYATLYNLSMRNPGNISLPRRLYLGVRFTF